MRWLHKEQIEKLIVPSAASSSSVQVWIATQKTDATMHFDAKDNCFCQLLGNKRILLATPQAWPHLKVYPTAHPARRATQLPAAAFEAAKDRAPVAALQGQVQEALVAEGDVLWIPRGWFNGIKSVGDRTSVSVSVWSASDAFFGLEPIPWASQLSTDLVDHTCAQLSTILQEFLAQTLVRTLNQQEVGTMLDRIAESYATLGGDLGRCDSMAFGCFDAEEGPDAGLPPAVTQAEIVEKAITYAAAWKKSRPPAKEAAALARWHLALIAHVETCARRLSADSTCARL